MIIVRVESQWTLFADTTDYFLTSCYVEHLNTTFIDYSQNCFTTPQYLMGSSYNSPISHPSTTNILEDEKLFLQSHQRESISPLGRRETFSSFGESWSEIWDKLIIIRKEKVLRTNEAYLFSNNRKNGLLEMLLRWL